MKHSLRGHHLICLHFYHGRGYSQEFIIRLDEIVSNIASEGVIIVSGADDVCMMCPHLKEGKCYLDEGADEQIMNMDMAALSLLGLKQGEAVQWRSISNKLPSVIYDWRREYCTDCQWKRLCNMPSD